MIKICFRTPSIFILVQYFPCIWVFGFCVSECSTGCVVVLDCIAKSSAPLIDLVSISCRTIMIICIPEDLSHGIKLKTSGKLQGTAGCCLFFTLFFFVFVFRVLHEHIQRLSKVVTANHKALQIPEVKTSPFLDFCVGVLGFDCVLDGERVISFYS